MNLVDTETAIASITPPGTGRAELGYWRRVIYNRAREGKITNYGAPGKGRALWDLDEIKALKGS